jgi:alpha-mannosidase
MKTIHLICNAHLDPVWLWDWEEGAAAAVATFRSAADLAERYDYIFCHNEALLYEWVEEYEPALFERIKKLVKAGKWHVMGGWYLQPDCNMPSGESLVRQIMRGRAYFAQKFGEGYLPQTAVNFDSFGHSWGLPQILKKCGYKNYLHGRPVPENEQGNPTEPFIWRGPDGSKVITARIGDWYNSALGKLNEKVERYYDKLETAPDIQTLCWGVGNHGGGPSAKDLAYINREIKHGKKAKLIHSTPDAYFETVEPKAVFERAINTVFPGCYTSLIRIKQRHRELENRLYSSEKMLSAATLNGLMEYPADELREAENALLFCQFHDILPGTVVRKGEESSLKRLSHGIYLLDKLRARAFFALCAGLPKAEGGTYPILVYNAHPYAVGTSVDCEFVLADQNWDESFWTGAEVYDGNKKLPSQSIGESSSLNLDWAKRVIFDCELQPFTMHMFTAKTVKTKRFTGKGISENYVYEDSYRRVVFDAETGFIDGITIGGKQYVGSGAFTPTVYADNGDPWAMRKEQTERLGKREKPFELMTAKESAAFIASALPEITPLRIIEDGEVCQIIEGFYRYNRSTMIMRYTLYKNSANLDVDLRVVWNESDKMLKFHIPVALKGEYVGQIAYGAEALPQTGKECVTQQWVSYGDQDSMVAIINDGVYGSSCDNGDIGITLLRGAVYAAHPISDRPLFPQDRAADRIDRGERFFRFRLLAGTAAELAPRLDRMAQVFNERPYAMNLFPAGGGNASAPALRLSDDTVALTAFKRACNGDGYIIRLFNNTDSRRSTVLTVRDTSVTVRFDKYAFKTIRYKDEKLTECESAEI